MSDYTDCIIEFEDEIKDSIFGYLDKTPDLLACAYDFYRTSRTYVIAFNGNRLDRCDIWTKLLDVAKDAGEEYYRAMTYSTEYSVEYMGDLSDDHSYIGLVVVDGNQLKNYEDLKRC